MSTSKLYTAILFMLLSFCKGQDKVVCRVDPLDASKINVKWYFSNLINPNGFNIYRREQASTIWLKLNTSPLKPYTNKADKTDLKKEKDLKSYMDLASNPANLKDLALLASIIKSFNSEEFSRYIGIWFDDPSTERYKEYEYKVTLLSETGETNTAVSEKVRVEKYSPPSPSKNITYTVANKKVSFKWEPEVQRYYGTHIYRRTGDTGQFTRITKDPVILSKTKQTNGEMDFGKEFFVDQKLQPGVTYHYYFSALDFFGSHSFPSDTLAINIKDLDAPKAPDSISSKPNGKKVTLIWKKKKKEEDLAGYNIYRTTKNDTDFVKLNQEIIPSYDSTYLDTVPRFSSYMYAVSCVDKNNNESVSNPHHAEAYDNEPPTKPQNLRTRSDSGQLILEWDKNTEEDVKGYLIYRTIDKNSAGNYVKLTPKSQSNNYFKDFPAKNTKNKFLYKVVAVDESMNRSPYSEFAIASLPDVIAPSAPFLKTISGNERNQVVLEWMPNAEPDLGGYHVYRKNRADSSSDYEKINAKPLARSVFRYTDRYPQAGKIYQYYLVAFDSSLNVSAPSNGLTYKPRNKKNIDEIKIHAFAARYDGKKKQVELKWKIDSEAPVKECIVYKTSGDGIRISHLIAQTEAKTIKDEDITKGSSYSYQLRVYNTRGDAFRSEKITLNIK